MADDDAHDETGFRSIFDGRTLDGWHAAPRVYGTVRPGGPLLADVSDGPLPDPAEAVRHAAVWRVEDGAIVGEQDAPGSGFGGYLVSDEAFGDIELRLQMRPDWPADTGVMLRRLRDSWEGLQVLVDHRRSGSIGGFYGNGLAGFHAVPFSIDAGVDAAGRPDRLVLQDPATSVEPLTPEKRALLRRAGDPDAFLAAWRFGDWNDLRVRCVGALPVLTTWVNDVLVAELDVAAVVWPGFDAAAVLETLGPRGHIAFEVHDNDPLLGEGRWGVGAACRWRDVRVRDLAD